MLKLRFYGEAQPAQIQEDNQISDVGSGPNKSGATTQFKAFVEFMNQAKEEIETNSDIQTQDANEINK